MIQRSTERHKRPDQTTTTTPDHAPSTLFTPSPPIVTAAQDSSAVATAPLEATTQGEPPLRFGHNISEIRIFPDDPAPVGAIAASETAPLTVQTALRMNAIDDPFEHQAEQVANIVMRMPAHEASSAHDMDAPPLPIALDAQAGGDVAGTVVPSALESRVMDLQGRGAPLSPSERTFFESRMGADFSQVQIHTDANAADLAQSFDARAFTIDTNVVFGAGEYQPDTEGGRHLLAHELTHVMQQTGGIATKRIQRTPGEGYEDGNRPDPSTSSDPTFDIVSDAPRIMTVGQRVTYSVVFRNQILIAPDTPVTYRWYVINDPAAVAQTGIDETVAGPTEPAWTLQAMVPGTHLIRAEIDIGGRVSYLEYSQQVVSNDRSYVAMGSGVTPATLATIQDFIALVERIEAAYAGLPWQDITSRIRKEYYPGPGNGAYSGIRAAFTWDDLIDEQEVVPPLQSPPVAMADIAALRRTQTVAAPGGDVDIGHVLTGVDSMNFPNVAGIFARHNTSGPAAATWSGDVGSALVNYATDATLNDDSDETREHFYQSYAGRDDMFGDYDGIVLADLSSLPDDAPLSQRLRTYYITDAAQGVQRRFHNFCQVSGFTVSNGRLDDAARTYIREQIERFANAFNVEGIITDAFILQGGYSPEVWEITSMHRIASNLDWFVNRFIQEVEAGLSSEQ